MSIEIIKVTHSNLAEALATVHALNLTLGRDCQVDFTDFTLRTNLDAIDSAIENSLDEPDTTPTDPDSIINDVSTDPQRLTRLLYLAEEQTEHLFSNILNSPIEEGDRASAWRYFISQRNQVREAAIAPIIADEVTPGSTLIYGPTPIEGAEVVDEFDGKSRRVHTLIHWSKPATPEDAALRECRVKATQTIITYQVVGVDESIDDDTPCYSLTPSAWRNLLRERMAYRCTQ